MRYEDDQWPPNDEPPCWAPAPGGGVRCGLEVDHDGEHHYSIWAQTEDVDA